MNFAVKSVPPPALESAHRARFVDAAVVPMASERRNVSCIATMTIGEMAKRSVAGHTLRAVRRLGLNIGGDHEVTSLMETPTIMYVEKLKERRIRDSRRMKAKALIVAKISWSYVNPDRAVKHADYLAVCSCTMCGNPRRHFGARTLQELRAMELNVGKWDHPTRY